MKPLLLGLSALALLLSIVPPVLTAAGKLDAELMKQLLLAGTVLWFVVWPAALGPRR
jgi:hypothetical protein